MLIIVRLTWQWPITALMLYIKLGRLPLFQYFDKIFIVTTQLSVKPI